MTATTARRRNNPPPARRSPRLAVLLLLVLLGSVGVVALAEEQQQDGGGEASSSSSSGDGESSSSTADAATDTASSAADSSSKAEEEGKQQQQQQQDEDQANADAALLQRKKAAAKAAAAKEALGGDGKPFDASSTDWGTYYDPQNVFCGNFDCYQVLGLDYELVYGKDIDKSIITKRYRALSREWHPDKSKHRDAKERFVKIARAYEVLTNAVTRKEYDDMRYDPEKYYMKYGTSVLWSYAPKSDTTFVMILLMVVGNVISYFSQKHRWRLVADRLVRAAVEDWSPSQGGTPESKHLREDGLAILADREKNATSATAPANGSSATGGGDDANPPSPGSAKKTKVRKLSGKEKKRQQEEALFPIVQEIVYAMPDFGGGFHKPTWRDLLIVSLAKLPFKLGAELWWFTKYGVRRLRGLPLTDAETSALTQRAVGPLPWGAATEEERQKMVDRELWVVANLAEWSEEQEFNKLSAGERKEILRMKKKGITNMDTSLMKED